MPHSSPSILHSPTSSSSIRDPCPPVDHRPLQHATHLLDSSAANQGAVTRCSITFLGVLGGLKCCRCLPMAGLTRVVNRTLIAAATADSPADSLSAVYHLSSGASYELPVGELDASPLVCSLLVLKRSVCSSLSFFFFFSYFFSFLNFVLYLFFVTPSFVISCAGRIDSLGLGVIAMAKSDAFV